MTVEDLISAYLQHLNLRNYSPRTIESNRYQLQHLLRFFQERNLRDIQTVTTATLTEFQSWLFYQPTPSGTARGIAYQNRVLSSIKTFFKFLAREGLFARNPAETVEYAREPQSLPRNILTPQEAKKIIESMDTTTVRGYRDRAIMEVFYATGIRSQELIGLRVADVNLEEELLRINEGKGGKDRVVPLSRVACKFLETYIKGIRPELLKESSSDRLFLSFRGKPIHRYNLGNLVKKYARLAGIKKHVTCHVWRHTCVTHLLKNNANLRHVQAILGHGSLATTERYLRLTITDLKAAHVKCHPRERDYRDVQRKEV